MEYVNLDDYAVQMVELNKNRGDIKPHRFKAKQDRLAYEIHRILKPSIRRLAAKKNMSRDLQDDIDQHAFIAICLALENWDQTIASFSTHVHWQVRAELQKLQHYQFPERRRLAIPEKIKFVELDKPIYGDQSGSSTMADQLVDETSENDVEFCARRHIALHSIERVFSHLIARQMQSYSMGQNDEEKIAKRRVSLMRNRWIYLRRTLFMENYEQIAHVYNVSRERVRQIISSMDDELRGQLPRFCKKTNEILPATKMPPETIHPCWDFMLIDFYMATGEDTRLFGFETPMPTRVEAYDFRPVVEISEEVPAAAEEKQVEKVEPKQVARKKSDDNVISIDGYKRAKALANAAIIAGSMLSSVVAANAQSRAIPPESAIVAMNPEKEQNDKPAVKTAKSVIGGVKKTAIIPIADMNQIRSKGAWGIKIAEYPTLQDVKKSWYKDTSAWQWLKGLQPTYSKATGNQNYSLAFGPMSERQAVGMCHEAKRYSKACQVIPFGHSAKTENKVSKTG